MRVSQARLNEVIRIRDAALKIIGDHGISFIRPGFPCPIKEAERNGLKISLMPVYGRTLDIWDDRRKVLNVAWDITGAVTVVGFHPGPWRERL